MLLLMITCFLHSTHTNILTLFNTVMSSSEKNRNSIMDIHSKIVTIYIKTYNLEYYYQGDFQEILCEEESFYLIFSSVLIYCFSIYYFFVKLVYFLSLEFSPKTTTFFHHLFLGYFWP